MFVPRFLLSIGGPRYDPTRPKDLAELRRLAYSLYPALDAIRDRIKTGGALPDILKGLPGLPTHFEATFPSLHCFAANGSFALYYKIGWDPSLYYYESDHSWEYDPGDGSASTIIDL